MAQVLSADIVVDQPTLTNENEPWIRILQHSMPILGIPLFDNLRWEPYMYQVGYEKPIVTCPNVCCGRRGVEAAHPAWPGQAIPSQCFIRLLDYWTNKVMKPGGIVAENVVFRRRKR